MLCYFKVYSKVIQFQCFFLNMFMRKEAGEKHRNGLTTSGRMSVGLFIYSSWPETLRPLGSPVWTWGIIRRVLKASLVCRPWTFHPLGTA